MMGACCSKLREDEVLAIDRKVYTKSEFLSKVIESDFVKLDTSRRRVVVDELIRQEILVLEAEQRGIQRDSTIKVQIASLKDNLIVEKVIEEEVWAPLLSDSSLHLLYERLGREVGVNHIIVTFKGSPRNKSDRSEEKALAFISRIKQDIENKQISFRDAVRKYSDGPSATKGGFMGYLRWGQLFEPVQTVAFSLPLRRLSSPIKLDFGYHLIWITGIRMVELSPFEEEITKLKEFIRRGRGKEFEMALKRFESMLKRHYRVRFNGRTVSAIFNAVVRSHGEKKGALTAREIPHIDVNGIVCTADGEPYGVEWFKERVAFGGRITQSLILSERSLKLTLEHIFYRYLTILFAKETRDDEWHGHIERQGKRRKIIILRKEVVFQLAEENPDISSEKILIQSLVESYKIRINSKFISSYSTPQESL
ncbi:MAG: peptidylprolyl isomerase [Candidatus Marinimicrobia bacterium]|nr:peptidylprolyl isomerase [Candidatus Neomarinimicrobiota bacterium]